jgi:hypothetical protein
MKKKGINPPESGDPPPTGPSPPPGPPPGSGGASAMTADTNSRHDTERLINNFKYVLITQAFIVIEYKLS